MWAYEADALDSLRGFEDTDPLSFVVREIPPAIRPYIGNQEKLDEARKVHGGGGALLMFRLRCVGTAPPCVRLGGRPCHDVPCDHP